MRGVPSELAGTAGLWVAAAAALAIAFASRSRALDSRRVRAAACVVLALQLVHCAEEYATGFTRAFPAALGLTPWSNRFFVLFNAGWMLAWTLAIATTLRGRLPLIARAALWFLALAALGNAAAHPILALAAGGYFPGLVTALPLGLAGGVLAARLVGR